MEVIQIGHKKRQGKDTFADYIAQHAQERGLKVEKLSFAYALKDIMAEALDMQLETLEELKNTNDYFRGMLQRFGNGKIKEYLGRNVWVDIVKRRIEELEREGYDLVIISDFRFPYEALEGAKTFNVVRNRDYIGTHESETALDDYPYDTIIHNTGTLEDLSKMALQAVKNIFEG